MFSCVRLKSDKHTPRSGSRSFPLILTAAERPFGCYSNHKSFDYWNNSLISTLARSLDFLRGLAVASIVDAVWHLYDKFHCYKSKCIFMHYIRHSSEIPTKNKIKTHLIVRILYIMADFDVSVNQNFGNKDPGA